MYCAAHDSESSLTNFEANLKLFELKRLIILALLAAVFDHLIELVQILCLFLVDPLSGDNGCRT